MKLKEFGILIRTIGILCLLLFIINSNVKSIPLLIIIMIISLGYLCSAISCSAKLFEPSIKHHKIVNYFIALLGIIFIIKTQLAQEFDFHLAG
jgi:hypothetical protein